MSTAYQEVRVKNTFIECIVEGEGSGRRVASCPPAVRYQTTETIECPAVSRHFLPVFSTAAPAAASQAALGGRCSAGRLAEVSFPFSPGHSGPAPSVDGVVGNAPVAPEPSGDSGVAPIDECCDHGLQVCGFKVRQICACLDLRQYCHHPACVARKIAKHKANKREQQRRRRQRCGR
mmetsp:Transcript_22782/g.51497  ORF Transcript_22782/g.51497 Transcript_22782/m.51497 type:complete len:177 (+) Transcript_22782:46-576(+)